MATLVNKRTGETLGQYMHRNETFLVYKRDDGTIGQIDYLDAETKRREDVSASRCESFVVIVNTPGYMPEDDDPFVTDDYAAAVEYMNARAAEYAEDGCRIEYGWASGDNFAALMIFDDSKTHDLGRVIEILRDES